MNSLPMTVWQRAEPEAVLWILAKELTTSCTPAFTCDLTDYFHIVWHATDNRSSGVDSMCGSFYQR